jgi:drug/metabolite transporter (DMT)-like permease
VLWGGVYPGAKLALREIPVSSFTFLRVVLAAAVLGALWLRRSAPRRFWAPLMNAGIAQAVFQSLAIASLHWTTAGQVAILFAVSPIMTAGWLALRRRDHLDGRRWGGLLVGFVGVGLVVGGATGGLDWSRTVGDLLALVGAAAWVWFSLAVGPVVGSLGMWEATGWTVGIAALLLSPLAIFEAAHHEWWRSVSWEGWGGLIYAAMAGGVVANALWGRSMFRLGPRQTMVYGYLEPVSAVIIAAIILGESLSAIQAAGGLLTLVGVWLASDSGMVSE